MNKEQFNALLPIICASLIDEICWKQHISESEATEKLYVSQLYSLLEQEDMKVWHYSTQTLYALLEEEETTGVINFPDT